MSFKKGDMKKILWLSNRCIDSGNLRGSGGWIVAMARALIESKYCQLYNITIGPVDRIEKQEGVNFVQWILPIKSFVKKDLGALPPDSMLQELRNIIEQDIRPDLIHVWGTERFWGKLKRIFSWNCPALLEIQGVKAAIAPYVYGGLSAEEQIRCIRLREIICPKLSLFSIARHYRESIHEEEEIIKSFKYVSYQSEWTRETISPFILGQRLFHSRRMIREDFLCCKPWKYKNGNHAIFSSCGLTNPNKGAHVLVRAFSIIRKRYPNAELHLTGAIRRGIRQNGYAHFLLTEIQKNNLADGVKFLGALSANELIQEMQECAVGVVPSFVESYSASLAEGLAVGLPMVASYAGAMPEVGGPFVSYFPIGDVGICAAKIMKIFELGEEIGENVLAARLDTLKKHSVSGVIRNQIDIYEDIFMRSKNGG